MELYRKNMGERLDLIIFTVLTSIRFLEVLRLQNFCITGSDG